MVGRLAIAVLAAVFICNVSGCSMDDDSADISGIRGQTNEGDIVCCADDCGDRCKDDECDTTGSASGNCCTPTIVSSGTLCDAEGGQIAPCIIELANSPAPTPESMTLAPAPGPQSLDPTPGPTAPQPTPEPMTPAPIPEPTAPEPTPEPMTPAPMPEPTAPAPTPAPTAPEPTPAPTLAAGDDSASTPTASSSERDSPITGAPATDGEIDDTELAAAGNSDSTISGDTTAIIVLAVLLAAVVVGLAAWCFMCRRKAPSASSSGRRDPGALAELGQAQKDLEMERNRRARAEALVNRAKGGGIRPGDFPSVRDVFQNVDQLADDALTWTEKACAIAGSNRALPTTLQSILESTFLVCREEVKRCLDRRLQSLSNFLGNNEPVLLSGGDAMNLDTQYVLYECLCKNYETIVPVEPDDMSRLAGTIVGRSQGPQQLAESIVFGDGWHAFQDLMENYMKVFVEMALQKPRMDFEDDLGQEVAFNPVNYRDLAPYCKAPVGQKCRIVFPALLTQQGRPKQNAKIGVVRIEP